MTFSPITSWQIDGETMETVTDFLGSKTTEDGGCSHEIQRCLLLGRKAMTNLDSILNSRHYFANKGPSSQSYGFSNSHVWMWELHYREYCWRIDAFELWCWRRLLRVPWTARRSNQSILKEIDPEYPLKGLILKLKLQLLWPPDVKNWLIGKDPDARKYWRQEEREMTEDELVGWHHRLDGREFEQAPRVGDGQDSLACCSPWGH